MALNRPKKNVTRIINSDNLFTDSVELSGHFNVSISGTWSGILTVRRSFDAGNTWFDVKTFTTNAQEYGFEPEAGVFYCIGSKVGEFTSGATTVRLSQ